MVLSPQASSMMTERIDENHTDDGSQSLNFEPQSL